MNSKTDEMVPTMIYILMRHGDDPEEAIVRAVNDTKDCRLLAQLQQAEPAGLQYR